MDKDKIEQGSHKADDRYHITIKSKGPYLVFGRPPLKQRFITLNERGECWDFRDGREFSTESEPTALCRCGASKNKPYCDGTHVKINWSGEMTIPDNQLLDDAEYIKGQTLTISDNEDYCVFARFCDAAGSIWSLVNKSDRKRERDIAIREANMCPGGRLSAWDNKAKEPFEPSYEPSLGLIEDPTLMVSGGLWVRGGIPISLEDGSKFEIRNRVVLCRCGGSSNKPFCDGTHVSVRFDDEIGQETMVKNEA